MQTIGNPLSSNMNTMADGWLQGRGEGNGEVMDIGAVIGVPHNVSVAEADLQSNNLGESIDITSLSSPDKNYPTARKNYILS